jgi:3-deoxy-D-manno-octulosonate 8-phosphate phosphatase (KDO 8-P phosphatase)
MSEDVQGRPFPVDRARRIRLVVFDVDGVLTDAGVYMGRLPDGKEVELKRFDIQDGVAMKLLRKAGLLVAIVSGRLSEATSIRAKEIGVDDCLQDREAQKLTMMKGLMERHGVGWDEVAMLGDDLPDIPVLAKAGLPVVVGNATPEAVEYSAWRTRARGGHGAVREFCRELLIARGDWETVWRGYVQERGGV